MESPSLKSNESLVVPSTSTTKALLVFIQVPKVHRIYVSRKKNEEKTRGGGEEKEEEGGEAEGSTSKVTAPSSSAVPSSTNSSSTFASLRSEKPLVPVSSTEESSIRSVGSTTTSNNNNNKNKTAPQSGEHDIGYVEGTGTKRNKANVEHVVTAEEMAAIVSLDDDDDDAVSENNEKGNATTTATEQRESIAVSVMKVFFGVTTDKEDETKTRLNREEAIRAMKEQSIRQLVDVEENDDGTAMKEQKIPAPNTEIKVEALLQLTCKNLYNEGCFYMLPSVSSISKGEVSGDGGEEWIQLTIMCKPNSIGLVLERLERIGIGSAVGMISIYKSELLKSADHHYRHHHNQDQKPSISQQSADNPNNNTNTNKGNANNLEAARAERKNAASRLRIQQVKEQIHEQASWSFDFASLLIIASILAGVGLITNSTVVIVASMLVSPIMGPGKEADPTQKK